MNELTSKLTATVLDTVAAHLGQEVEELDDLCTWTDQPLAEIEAAWHGFSRDLMHLSREDKESVLRRCREYTPELIDGCEVRLYNAVQTRPNATRTSAAVVDAGDVRIVWLY